MTRAGVVHARTGYRTLRHLPCGCHHPNYPASSIVSGLGGTAATRQAVHSLAVRVLLLGNSNDSGQWFEGGRKRHEFVQDRNPPGLPIPNLPRTASATDCMPTPNGMPIQPS